MPGRIFLWLLLSGPVQERFAALIDALSGQLGTSRFIPHITLMGPIDLSVDETVLRVVDLATRLTPIPLRLTDVSWTDEHYRCLFIRAEPSEQLIAAHRAACAALGQPVEPDFMPHLSLVYGDLSAERKTQVVNEIGRHFDVVIETSHVGLCLATGGPAQWRLIQTFALGG
jgi:2'-5' RNA ligase